VSRTDDAGSEARNRGTAGVADFALTSRGHWAASKCLADDVHNMGQTQQRRPILTADLDGQANSSRTFAETFTGLLAPKLFTAEPGTLTEVLQTGSKHPTLIPADVTINNVERPDLATIELPAAHRRRLSNKVDRNKSANVDAVTAGLQSPR